MLPAFPEVQKKKKRLKVNHHTGAMMHESNPSPLGTILRETIKTCTLGKGSSQNKTTQLPISYFQANGSNQLYFRHSKGDSDART